MAKVNPVRLCPSCGVELQYTLPTAEKCAACGFQLTSPTNTPFESPDYLSYQRADLAGAIDRSKLGDSEAAKQRHALERHLLVWSRTCTDADRVAAMGDATYILRGLLLSNAAPENIKKIVKMGKRLGELANAIDTYAQASGGSFYDIPAAPTTTDDIESIDQT